MDVSLISVDGKEPSSEQRKLRMRDLGRVIGLARPYRRKLITGIVFTVAFAGLYTLSIATVFPVFKILLDSEGLAGWAHRTVAGERLGVSFAPIAPQDPERLVVVRVSQSLRDTFAPGDRVRLDEDTGRAADQLRRVAEAGDGTNVIMRRTADGAEVAVDLDPPDIKLRALMRAVGWLPADADSDTGKFRTLVIVLVALFVLVLIGNTLRYLGEIQIMSAVFRSLMDLRAQLYERVLQLPMGYFSGASTSDVVTRFVQDIQEIQRGLTTFYGKCIREPLKAVLVLGLAFALDWRITLTLIVVVPITLAIFFAVGRSVKKANRRLLKGYGMMIDALTASLQSLPVVKVYTAEPFERKRLAAVDFHMFRQQLKLARLQAFVSPMIETLAVVAAGVATAWLASMVLYGGLPIATFGTLGVALAMLFDPLRKLTDVYVRIQRSTVGAERIFQVLEMPVESDDNTAHDEAGPLQNTIEFRDVTFTYPSGEAPALSGVDLTIKCGETIALIGPNGCGKSTLVSMIPRLNVPDAGTVLYDGQPLDTLELSSLRRHISVVSQDAVIFAGTPLMNIGYGEDAPDRDKVIAAARRAFADDFVSALPGGYDASLGERGTTLSGGQRQRLAIARAIYRDAPILIFDEATSQIDSESERRIQDALKDFAVGRTTIIIAHRLSTIQFASRIVVMDRGRIVATGRHETLLEESAFYRRLCETQFGGQEAESR